LRRIEAMLDTMDDRRVLLSTKIIIIHIGVPQWQFAAVAFDEKKEFPDYENRALGSFHFH